MLFVVSSGTTERGIWEIDRIRRNVLGNERGRRSYSEQ